MTITLRSTKGSALTYNEMDANFTTLLTGQTTGLDATGGTIDGQGVTLTGGAGLLWANQPGHVVVPNAGANLPTWTAFRSGIYAYAFSASVLKEIWINFLLPHDVAPGTVLYPHIRWSTTGTNAGAVRWGIEFTVAKGFSQQAFPASTTVYITQNGSGTAYQHMSAEVSEVDAIPATSIEPGSLILTRLFRDAAHASDNQTDVAFLLMAGLHYQKQYFGTVNKQPNFYV